MLTRGQSRHNLTQRINYDKKFIEENHGIVKAHNQDVSSPQLPSEKVELNVRKTLASSDLANKLATKSAHKLIEVHDEDFEDVEDVKTDKSDGHQDIDHIFDDIDSVEDDSEEEDDDDSINSRIRLARKEAAGPDRFMPMTNEHNANYSSLVDVHRSFMSVAKEKEKDRDYHVVGSMRTLLRPHESIYSPQHEKNPANQSMSNMSSLGARDSVQMNSTDAGGAGALSSKAPGASSSFLFLSKLTDSFRSPQKSSEQHTRAADAIQAIAKGASSPEKRVVDAAAVVGKWSVNKEVSQTTAHTLSQMDINIGTKKQKPQGLQKKQSVLDKLVTTLTQVTPPPSLRQ